MITWTKEMYIVYVIAVLAMNISRFHGNRYCPIATVYLHTFPCESSQTIKLLYFMFINSCRGLFILVKLLNENVDINLSARDAWFYETKTKETASECVQSLS